MNQDTIKEAVAEMHGDVKKVFGPYKRRDNRKVVIVIFNDGRRKTISWPKAIYEAHHRVVLGPEMTVDHVNGDLSDDSINNLRAVDRKTHITKDVIRVRSVADCPICGTRFELSKGQRCNRTRNGAGPFCSKKCVSVHIGDVIGGRVKGRRKAKIEKIYYNNAQTIILKDDKAMVP